MFLKFNLIVLQCLCCVHRRA